AVLVSTRAPVDLRVPGGLLIGSLVVVALLALALARLLSRGLTARLDRVATAAEALADGDLSARSGVSGDDEIATVGAAFDAMAGRLE
ncbi:MAG: HAMP domain-containing protein, partial [Actinobacteria bacterium]|nr:HAMP domain-containing protein [Actinomycetota bacterium]NIY09620.1 HAMP domain-containing protein [Gemmatimonadota bacterium]NIT96191.1 HAMP domain-containing protein [Actinomycetota bacterium]NIU19876.1 HAMP domain-containing protein [Actinomycetota bacterium]NIU67325.1 HAMP domain-containing protein [Actinomycetota bacterium]